MTRHEVDMVHVREQLYRAGYSHENGTRGQSISSSVQRLITALNQMDADQEYKAEVVSAFSRLASGASIAPANVTGEVAWIDLEGQLSSLEVGQTVRVKPDAYDLELGTRHNGMVGTVVAVRGGEVVVSYGMTSDTTGVHLPVDKLQALAR